MSISVDHCPCHMTCNMTFAMVSMDWNCNLVTWHATYKEWSSPRNYVIVGTSVKCKSQSEAQSINLLVTRHATYLYLTHDLKLSDTKLLHHWNISSNMTYNCSHVSGNATFQPSYFACLSSICILIIPSPCNISSPRFDWVRCFKFVVLVTSMST
jgi:hypothetical protein